MSYSSLDDQEFEAFAKQAEKEAQERAKNKSSSSSGDYEKIKWTGLVPNVMKVVRAVGSVPGSHKENYTARTVRISKIVGDNGKTFRCILPEREDNEAHLIWKIIARVNDVTYQDKKKVFINETKHPEIFNLINKNGLTGKRAMYDSGWSGKTMFVMNCIDREMMDWHRANKHYVLLSKNVNVADNGNEFADEGVPAFGFMNLITTGLFKFYKDWRGYDMGITRLGLKETPYRIINASKYFEEVPENLQPLVVKEPGLSDEELSWQAYNLDKLFALTSYTKIFNKLKLTIAKIDATLGTQYMKELEYEVEKEKQAMNEANADRESNPHIGSDFDNYEDDPAPQAPVAPQAQATTRVPTNTRKPVEAKPTSNTALLKNYSILTDSEKSMIAEVIEDKTAPSGISVKYNTEEDCPQCPKCLVSAPLSFTHCPNCGEAFE